MQRNEEFEGVFRVRLSDTALDLALNPGFSFLPMTGETKEFVFVGPEYGFVLAQVHI